jgi:hypothetical protein
MPPITNIESELPFGDFVSLVASACFEVSTKMQNRTRPRLPGLI